MKNTVAVAIVFGTVFLSRGAALIALGDRVLEPRQDQYIFAELATGVREGRGISLDAGRFDAKASFWKSPILGDWVREPGWAFGLVPVGSRTSAYEPLFPYTLGATTKSGLSAAAAARLLNLIFCMAAAAAAYAVGRRLFGVTGGLFAALGVTLYPLFFFYNLLIMAESVHLSLFAIVLAAYYALDDRPFPAAVVLGLAAAAFFLVRAIALPVTAIALAFFAAGSRRRSLKTVAMAAAFFAAALIPWAVRNYDVHGTFLLAPTRGGVNLWMRNNPEVLALEPGELGHTPPSVWNVNLRRRDLLTYPNLSGLNEVQRDRVLTARAAAFVRANPGTFARLCGVRLVNTIRPYGELVKKDWQKTSATAAYVYALLFGGVGVAVLWAQGQRRAAAFPVTLFLFYVAYHAIIHGGVRYRLPADFGLLVLAGGGAAAALRKARDVMTKRERVHER